MSSADFDKMMMQESLVYYNGKMMKKSDADRLKRAEDKKKRIKKRNDAIIPLLPSYIKGFTKHLKLCKSLVAYRNNAYRQWGRIAYDIIDHPCVQFPFSTFCNSAREIEKNLTTIEKIAKSNDKDIFGFIEKLHYNIDDCRTKLDALSGAITESGILNDPTFKGKEAVYGTGRRLGIKELCSRTLTTMAIMQNTCVELEKICRNGIDAMEYDVDNKRTICYSERGMVKHGSSYH